MTATQPELFTSVLDNNPEFAEYLRKHGDAYIAFSVETQKALRNGEKPGQIGAKAIAERCRSRIRGGLDNRYVTLLSRLFEEKHGREVFRKRRRRA